MINVYHDRTDIKKICGRGQMQAQDMRGGAGVVNAMVPLINMFT